LIGIVAMNGDGCIGRDGRIPWHHSEDLQFFKRTTSGGTIVLGRKTWDGLPRKPLPRRFHVVLTANPVDRPAVGAVVFTDLDDLDRALEGAPRPVFVIGGARVYDLLWDRTAEFLVTRVPDEVVDGDTFFPRSLEPDFVLHGTTALSESLRVEHWIRRPAS
jgi:dihydrofolate reductase